MPYAKVGSAAAAARVGAASPVPYWLDSPARPAALAPLHGSERTDLLVVGGGFTGLWTALLAKAEDPSRDVVLLDGRRVAWAATGRNGGFCAASLTHGFANGYARWPDDLALLQRLGEQNLAAIVATVREHGIDCDLVPSGDLQVATEPHQLAAAADEPALAERYGLALTLLDREALAERVRSPLYLGAVYDPSGIVMLDPARLAWGLLAAARAAGVRVYEGARAEDLREDGAELAVTTWGADGPGVVHARQIALATNAFPPLLRRLRHYLVPVYDYVLVTEPLPDEIWAQIGWEGREGIGDSGNQFHYSHRTQDGRILYGGYDAIPAPRVSAARDQRPESFALLAEHLWQTYPALHEVAFSHAWGGAIDTCARFAPFMGTARGGRVAYAAGYTGLGVGASRFGAAVMLDLLAGRPTDRTDNAMVASMPLPFPPQPVRAAGIGMTRWSLARADEREGRRNLWLRLLDRLGMGFDS